MSQQLMDTRLPEKAVAQAQCTQKKAIPLSNSETWDGGFPLMTRNDPSFLVQTPRQKERRLATAASLVLEKAQPSATFLRGISERSWERGLWQAKQLRLSTKKAFILHFFFLSFNPSTVLEGATNKKMPNQHEQINTTLFCP